MPDEATAPAVEQDTSTEVTQEETSSAQEQTPSIDYEQRYNDLRPEFDRKNQLLAAAEGHQGSEAQAAALQQLGVEVEFEEEQKANDEYVDPDDRIDQLEARIAQEAQARQDVEFQQLEAAYCEDTLKALESEADVELTEAQARLVTNDALANRDADGKPDLKGAFDELKGIRSQARDSYRQSKIAAAAAPVGTAGEEKIDLSNPEERQRYMAELLDAEEGSE